ncbi:hypothetical protein BG006_002367 [Podila minutissima]|uniref:Uncharacterized protein n=1 Tax=Podila minutissima TaxID=64525 RepID=A0A9P5SCU4_9FUNG|nr:hypothetical protein BG006_002367 [Podila minutissima]
MYKGNQGLEPTTKWYEFIYSPGVRPMERDSGIKWAIKANSGAEPEGPKSKTCLQCGKESNGDDFDVLFAHGKSWYHPLCKECERKKRVSADPAQKAASYFAQWWRGRSLVFKSRDQASGFVLTVFLRGVCVGAPRFSGREVAHLRLKAQAQGSTSIDWYDHESLTAGDRDPMKQFTTDRITSDSDKKILPYSHRRQCTVAASAWKNEIFMDLTFKQRVDYMLYCLEEEMKIDFTYRDEDLWQYFCNNRHDKKERIIWDKYEWQYFLRVCNGTDLCSGLTMAEIGQRGNIDRLSSDGKYRLGACIYIPQGLNFAKELLEDFKTSKLFQGTDLENCREGIKMLRDLMIETAEKMKPCLSNLLDEHAALIVGSEDSNNEEVQLAEEIVKNICDQYEPEPDDMAITDCNNQDVVRAMDNTIEYEKDASKSSNLMAPEIDPWEYEKEAASSFWSFGESDEEDSFSDAEHDNAVSMLPLGEAKNVHQGNSKLFQRHIDHGEAESRSDVPFSTLTPPLIFEKERSGLAVLPKYVHARPQEEKGEPILKGRTQTLLVEDNNSQGRAHKICKSRLSATKALQNSMVPKSAMEKNMEQTISAAAVLSKCPSVASSLKQPPISDFLFRRDKENRPPQTALITQYFTSEHRNTAFEIEIPKHSRSEQFKATGHATDAAKRKDIESGKEAAAWASDDDFMSGRVTTRNTPFVKKITTKKQRH